jgi:prepilin-type N-terminal cleavage/methylation domain-containing protein/prepilin-type processing-associated H-X9-DG protein
MRKREAFTLIELLVVIAIIALLLSVIMPALKKAKEGAKALVCKNNMRQMSLGLILYTQDHNDLTMPLLHTAGDYWFHQIAPYLGDQNYRDTSGEDVSKAMKVSYCPVASKPHPSGGWGSAVYAWTFQTVTTGSYGMNLWLIPKTDGDEYDLWDMSASLELENCFQKYSEARANTPTFADCNWVGSWPDDTDRAYDLEEGTIIHSVGNFMGRFCIDRHSMAINVGFVDGHAGKVTLEDLWTLSWHKEFSSAEVEIE